MSDQKRSKRFPLIAIVLLVGGTIVCALNSSVQTRAAGDKSSAPQTQRGVVTRLTILGDKMDDNTIYHGLVVHLWVKMPAGETYSLVGNSSAFPDLALVREGDTVKFRYKAWVSEYDTGYDRRDQLLEAFDVVPPN